MTHDQEACTSSGTRFLGVCISPEDEIKGLEMKVGEHWQQCTVKFSHLAIW